MKLNQRKKVLIPLLLIFLLTSLTSVSNAQPNQTPSLQPRVNQEASSRENIAPNTNTHNLREAVWISQKDGTQRLVPVITGEILWWVIFTVLTGTLIAISVVVILGAFAHRHPESGEKNQFLSEALPTLVQGITIVYIVLAVILLSILGIASAEGTLSILAGISGYVLGKERSSRSRSKNNPSPEDET
ncbi:hypothetical protein ANSO36C_67560 (plasmid) [Nostoc cf. commune SO-36]|uniref:Uncharacterized protein n=1 Tax=Nostoc cf. commune SO-36 TaxID=449208 RepID=A0ABM7ZCE3_NOSCO|nr:hypothetical protein [Nostoc commune]BDI20954.1 hypothetical protein ANSO36C_67560 [Nostoc cf. commune SO-36]